MSGSAVYGLVRGVGSVLLTRIAPQPIGSILWWGVLAGQLTWGAALCWRRTALPFATAAMAIGAATSAILTTLAVTGRVFPDLGRGWWVLVGLGFVAGPLCLLVESRLHRAKWLQWGRYMERKNAWDIFTGLHIPDLGDSGA